MYVHALHQQQQQALRQNYQQAVTSQDSSSNHNQERAQQPPHLAPLTQAMGSQGMSPQQVQLMQAQNQHQQPPMQQQAMFQQQQAMQQLPYGMILVQASPGYQSGMSGVSGGMHQQFILQAQLQNQQQLQQNGQQQYHNSGHQPEDIQLKTVTSSGMLLPLVSHQLNPSLATQMMQVHKPDEVQGHVQQCATVIQQALNDPHLASAGHLLLQAMNASSTFMSSLMEQQKSNDPQKVQYVSAPCGNESSSSNVYTGKAQLCFFSTAEPREGHPGSIGLGISKDTAPLTESSDPFAPHENIGATFNAQPDFSTSSQSHIVDELKHYSAIGSSNVTSFSMATPVHSSQATTETSSDSYSPAPIAEQTQQFHAQIAEQSQQLQTPIAEQLQQFHAPNTEEPQQCQALIAEQSEHCQAPIAEQPQKCHTKAATTADSKAVPHKASCGQSGKAHRIKPQVSMSFQGTPQQYFMAIVTERGYACQRLSSSEAAYQNEPTPFQVASFGTQVVKAVHSGDTESLKAFLDSGLSPNLSNSFGDSILLLVCKRADEPVFKVLVDHDCDLQVSDTFGRTPLHHLAWSGKFSKQMIQSILDRDLLQLLVQDKQGKCALEYVRKEHFTKWINFLKESIDTYWPIDKSMSPLLTATLPKERGSVTARVESLSVALAAKVAMGRISLEEVAKMDASARKAFSDSPKPQQFTLFGARLS